MTTSVAICGSTGSIGTQALDVIRSHADLFNVRALSAGGSRPHVLVDQIREFEPEYVAVASPDGAAELVQALAGSGDLSRIPTIEAGAQAVAAIGGTGCDVVVNGVDGAVGLDTTLAALATDSTLALANKESLVLGSDVVVRAAGGRENVLQRIVPVDSEHSAIAQCLRGESLNEVAELVVVASGGPFRGMTREQLHDVTLEQALQHPTWDMGATVTINSASMMNKALEIIEAHVLFDVPYARIRPVVHRQSIVHSLVTFIDGSTKAQCSPPTMMLPIALGLSWHERLPGVAAGCDWTSAATWTFEPVDEHAFPATRLAREAGEAGGTYTGVLNAANEVCVKAFTRGNLGFVDIVDTVERVLEAHRASETECTDSDSLSLEGVSAADAWARRCARTLIADRA